MRSFVLIRLAPISVVLTLLGACHKSSTPTDKERASERHHLDSLTAATLMDSILAEHGAAWAWKSLDFEYIISYQLAFDSIPIVAFPGFKMVDAWRADSSWHYLVVVESGGFRKVFVELTSNQPAMLTKLIPDPWESNAPSSFGTLSDYQTSRDSWLVAAIRHASRARFSPICEITHEGDENEYCSGEIVVDSRAPLYLRGELLEVLNGNGSGPTP